MGRGTDQRERCLRKFLRYFKKGFYDQKYIDWERGYKWAAHEEWTERLSRDRFESLLSKRKFGEIAALAVRTESRTNLLFSFEKMALRDAVKTTAGARTFAEGLYAFLHGSKDPVRSFSDYVTAISALPRKQTRVLTWPLLTVFPFIAQPERHLFLKPRVTQAAARAYGYEFDYHSKPQWGTYNSLLGFAASIRTDHPSLKPRDMIDLQSFIWVMGSDEYP